MLSIDKDCQAEYIINKSRFISFAYPVFDESSARKILENLNNEYRDATHICFAYILDGPSREKSSDDGEPTGTAGKPMIELLRKRKLSNILIAVVRYFGGIKLGAGGLVRAYTTASNMVLDNANFCEYVDMDSYNISVGLSNGNKAIGYLNKCDCEILSQKYEDRLILQVVGDIGSISTAIDDVIVEKIGSKKVCRRLPN